jgi:hypothetical protein
MLLNLARGLVVGFLVVACCASAIAAELKVLPERVTLRGPEGKHRLLVEEFADGKFRGEVTEGVTFASSAPEVVEVVDGFATPKGNGTATVTATVGERSATVEVTVEEFEQPHVWSFRNHVESVLAKTGCSTGACHGALAGKNGFKLSLRGYDPDGDCRTLSRQARGRRIVPSDPGRSLLLTKPTGAVPHKGGVRFDVGSPEYRVLAEWIAAGTPAPQESDARISHLEILPKQAVLKPGAAQQLIVQAHFSDGRVEDVTRWCLYSSTNQSVAIADDHGRVQVMGNGEGAVTAWYLSQVVIATVSAPYEHALPENTFVDAPRRNFIDELVLDKLQALNIPPSPRCGDEEFIRRAYLDTIGVLPTVAETKAFLADAGPEKRDRLIESLLARPEFVDYWTYKWADLLLVNSTNLSAPAMWSYYNWVRDNVAANTPWDEFARRLVTATGSTLENGATNFFVLHKDPPDLSETVSQAFLGMSIGCAKCHNHPMEKWTNGQYFAMANLLARVRVKDGQAGGSSTVFAATSGELVQPLTGKPQRPQPLDGEAMEFESEADRRAHLAEWLTSPDNPYFARSVTNRVWANFFGVGLVESVDDMRLTNPASNPELLDAAAAYLIEQKFDLKTLMRAILQSEAYQRSSMPLAENAAEMRFYSRYYPRRLMAEVMLDALSQVSGAPTAFPGYPSGWRALQLPDSNVDSYFLKTFGRPERVITCECERTEEPSMVQVLHISNGKGINEKLAQSGNRIDQLLAANTPDEEIVREAYLSALCREPTEPELAGILAVLKETPAEERRQAVEDVFWGVLSSKEFLFNH